MHWRPIIIYKENLLLHYGLFNDAIIQLINIIEIKPERKSIAFNDEVRMLSVLEEIDSYNVVLRLKNKHTMTGLHGFTKTF